MREFFFQKNLPLSPRQLVALLWRAPLSLLEVRRSLPRAPPLKISYYTTLLSSTVPTVLMDIPRGRSSLLPEWGLSCFFVLYRFACIKKMLVEKFFTTSRKVKNKLATFENIEQMFHITPPNFI